MRRKDKRRLQTILIVLAVAGLSMLGKKMGWIDEGGDFRPPTASSAKPGSKDSLGDYELLRGCVLAKDRNNDGDSFRVRHGSEEYVLRLYFVDCPEKRRHQHNGDRIHDQAEYFGISDAAAIETGTDAKDLTLELLGKGAFDVATKWERVFNSERFYSFVMLPGDGDTDSNARYLCEVLVDKGLARIHTKGSDLPTGTDSRDFKDHLKDVEDGARSAKRGAWGRN